MVLKAAKRRKKLCMHSKVGARCRLKAVGVYDILYIVFNCDAVHETGRNFK
jgi:hypothetical protein